MIHYYQNIKGAYMPRTLTDDDMISLPYETLKHYLYYKTKYCRRYYNRDEQVRDTIEMARRANTTLSPLDVVKKMININDHNCELPIMEYLKIIIPKRESINQTHYQELYGLAKERGFRKSYEEFESKMAQWKSVYYKKVFSESGLKR